MFDTGATVGEESRAAFHRIGLRSTRPFRFDFASGILYVVGHGPLNVPVVILHSSTIMCGVSDAKLLARIDGRKRRRKSAVEDHRMVGLDVFGNLLKVSKDMNRRSDLSVNVFPMGDCVEAVLRMFCNERRCCTEPNLCPLPGKSF